MARIVVMADNPDIFVSLEDTPIVLAELRRSLPELTAELQKRWPVETVNVEFRYPRLKNPIDTSTVLTGAKLVAGAGVGLTIFFAKSVVEAAGKKVGDGLGEALNREITPYVLKWVRALFNHPKSPTRVRARRRKASKNSR